MRGELKTRELLEICPNEMQWNGKIFKSFSFSFVFNAQVRSRYCRRKIIFLQWFLQQNFFAAACDRFKPWKFISPLEDFITNFHQNFRSNCLINDEMKLVWAPKATANVALRKAEEKFFVFYRINSGCVVWVSVRFMSHGRLCLWRESVCLTQKEYKIISQRDTDKKQLRKICVVATRERKISLIKPPFFAMYCCTGRKIPKELVGALSPQLTCWWSWRAH